MHYAQLAWHTYTHLHEGKGSGTLLSCKHSIWAPWKHQRETQQQHDSTCSSRLVTVVFHSDDCRCSCLEKGWGGLQSTAGTHRCIDTSGCHKHFDAGDDRCLIGRLQRRVYLTSQSDAIAGQQSLRYHCALGSTALARMQANICKGSCAMHPVTSQQLGASHSAMCCSMPHTTHTHINTCR
jgi:hypothetical protein